MTDKGIIVASLWCQKMVMLVACCLLVLCRSQPFLQNDLVVSMPQVSTRSDAQTSEASNIAVLDESMVTDSDLQ